MATDREKEREAELESAMYTNCLLLGLDLAVLGSPSSPAGGPRVGLFRHSNPRLGEQLLYFLLSSLRGPAQSAKDFDKVWPIFDSAQSREFRKIVQGIISELEQQGALPRSNSRVSSLATCCGPRFVELLWQLSVHALREVHRRTFAADVASNPLPAALTDVSYLHAAALLPVTKARIALERRKFLKNANIAVQRQTTWSNLAHEMTAEFRSLCAEEAYLQQELEKLQDMRNKSKLEGELWDERISSSSGQNSHLVSKATRLWESILARKGQHEVLASGPIEDLIAHREHRYRISGSQLLAAMDLSSSVPHSELLSARAGEASPVLDQKDQMSALFQGKEEALSRLDDRNGRTQQQTVDVAEILRRWTHALQRIHKQSLHLAKANDGDGPELLRSASDSETSTHADSLTATLAEHRQHLVSIQGLINQLKEAIPAMQQSIADLSEEVNSVSSNPMDQMISRLSPPMPNLGLGRSEESSSELSEMTSRLSATHLDKAGSSPALKLPPLFSLTPSSSGKGSQTQKRNALAQPSQEILPEDKTLPLPSTKDETNGLIHENEGYFVHNIRRSVREAALSKPLNNAERPHDQSSDDGSEHFFIPLSTAPSRKEIDGVNNRRNQKLGFSSPQIKFPKSTSDIHFNADSTMHATPVLLSKLNGNDDPSSVTSMLDPGSALGHQTFMTDDDALDQVFSPPLLLETSLFQDTYEDLLAPLSETDTALMEH
ncbi:AUGMIN subunit 6 isoform X2 [Oryza brachyantha]|uniref:HAUS augmin-like complex subunit 6 N-terminal domain-containing protein n=1 Tax=Oryza brachyantha TaxID=4533 RepID=J3KU41_ORYBR|nr:AUGMIN subunit 6 isoform X2 [Oryza brachyantha]